jgi:Protein of unknown function (DUF3102)
MNNLVPSLDNLAAEINKSQEAIKTALWHGAMHAVHCGRALKRAKEMIPFGQFLEFLSEKCTVSERTAQLYMKLADEYPTLEAKAQCVADLTVNEAIRLLEPLKAPTEPTVRGTRKRRGASAIVTDAISRDPLTVLNKAWDAANEPDRNTFTKRINTTGGN